MRVRNDGLSLYDDVNLPQLADTSLFFDREQPSFFHQLAFYPLIIDTTDLTARDRMDIG